MDSNKPIIKMEDEALGLTLEYEVLNETDNIKYGALNQQLNDLKREIEDINADIYRLESHATLLDYSLSVASGALSGFLDIILTNNIDVINQDSIVKNIASSITKNEYTDTMSAINDMNKYMGSGQTLNNLDLASSASLFGLAFSVISALTGVKLLLSKKGELNEKKIKYNVSGNIFSAVFYGTVSWICNIISNNATLASNVPISLNSLVVEAKSSGLKLNGDIYSEVINNIDSRSLEEINNSFNALKLVGTQAISVGINEAVVRAIYFVRAFFTEVRSKNIKKIKQLHLIDSKKLIPFNNRTISRMISVSLATMMFIDVCDASIEASNASMGNKTMFASNFFIRINFVGVGRIVFALSNELYMSSSLRKKRKERINAINDYTKLAVRKLYCMQDDVWKECHTTQELISATETLIVKSLDNLKSDVFSTKEDLREIEKKIDQAFDNNAGLKNDIKDILDWE